MTIVRSRAAISAFIVTTVVLLAIALMGVAWLATRPWPVS